MNACILKILDYEMKCILENRPFNILRLKHPGSKGGGFISEIMQLLDYVEVNWIGGPVFAPVTTLSIW